MRLPRRNSVKQTGSRGSDLLIGGSADAAHVSAHHDPFVQAMRAAGAKNFTDVLLEADTYFLTARIALARLVIAWFRKQGF